MKKVTTMADTALLQDPAALTGYIEANNHASHRKHLPQLAQMAVHMHLENDVICPQFEPQ